MMTWEYRVFRETDGAYVIREIFYNDDGTLMGCTENAVEPMGESLKELAVDIESFKEALKLPVLTLADMPRPAERKYKRDRSGNRTLEQVSAELGLGKPPANRQRAAKNGKRVLAASGKKKNFQRMPRRNGKKILAASSRKKR